MSLTRERVLAVAASQVGVRERTGRNDVLYADRWGITGYAWCYAFVQWVFEQAGERLPFLTMYVPSGVQWCRDAGQNVERGGTPIPGDIVHFTWSMSEWPPDRPGTGDHVGIVEAVDGDRLICIEGNVGSPQGVWRMARSYDATVINFWRPSLYAPTAPPDVPAPVEEDEDVGFQIMSDPAQGGDGSVYGVWGCEMWAFSNDAIRNAYEQLGALKPGIHRVHQNTVNGFVYMGVIEAHTHTLATGPMPSTADLAGHSAGLANTVMQNSNRLATEVKQSSTADAAAVMQNSNKLAAGISTGGGTEKVLDVEASLKVASVKQLLDALSALTGK